jgi:DNA mismatch repair protein MutS
LNSGLSLDIKESRHPVVEANIASNNFIPNDIIMNEKGKNFVCITGPNMAGKSTYLRQTALIVLLAQIGSFVPAAGAEVGIVDKIFCRVGAEDNLAGGESTFLVEMSETAFILNSATERSLIIMDEVGRGTGTNDGLSIAQAVCEDILDRIKCRTLFATHYHELTELSHPRLVNRSMAIEEYRGEIIFKRKLVDGASSESYGIHVARLAGLSESVLKRASEIMTSLKATPAANIAHKAAQSPALSPGTVAPSPAPESEPGLFD